MPNGNSKETVLSIYLKLPAKYLNWEIDKLKTIKIKDIQNGYLFLERPSSESYAEMAVFTYQDKTIIGISESVCGPCCGTLNYKFINYKNGKFKDVTSSIFPQIPFDWRFKSIIKIPRYGTQIKIFNPGFNRQPTSKNKLYPIYYNWVNGKFQRVVTGRVKFDKTNQCLN